MSHPRFSLHTVVLALALAALLAAGLTLVVVAQDPDLPDTSIAQDPEGRDAPFAPGEVTAPEEPELLLEPSSPSTEWYFKFLSASAFVPRDNDMTYNYTSGGCVYRTGGDNMSVHSLELPQGAEITYLRIYFYDNDDIYEARAWIYAFDGNGNATEIADVESSGTPGQGSELSAPISYVVDNYAESLVVFLHYGYAEDAGLKICGVRVMYQYTPSIVDLPLILNGASP